nr:hypothetical protein [uncultured Clostridium sp.]
MDFEDDDFPKLVSVNNQIAYASITGDEKKYVIGPIKFEGPSKIKNTLSLFKADANWLKYVFSCRFDDLAANMLLVHNLYHIDFLDTDTIISHCCMDTQDDHDILKNYSEIVFQNQENETLHNPYNQEIREMKLLKTEI